MKKSTIEFTQDQLDDLWFALDTALEYFKLYDTEQLFEKKVQVLKSFKDLVHEESMKLDENDF